MKNICVFCGSSSGNQSNFEEKAFELGQFLAQKNIGLVYGGAKVGLMGAVANGALQNNGKVYGVLPIFLQEKELAHPELTELFLTENMHERKTKMHDLSDGIIALPGGFGTLEELFEMLTWGQLGLHKKPIALYNIDGFYDKLIEFVEVTIQQGFLKPVYRDMLLVSDSAEELIHLMNNYQAPQVGKWIAKNQT